MEAYIKKIEVNNYNNFYIYLKINDKFENPKVTINCDYEEDFDFVKLEDAELASINFLASSICNWEGIEESYSNDAAINLLRNNYKIRKQVEFEYKEFQKFINKQIDILVLHHQRELELNTMQGDGKPLRSHLLKAWEITGEKPEQLDQVSIPYSMLNIWGIYKRLDSHRTYHQGGPNSIQYSEILSFCSLTDTYLSNGDLDIIDRLDNVSLTHYYNQRKKKSK